MPNYRWHEYGDTAAHEVIADRIEVDDKGILVFVGVSSPVPFGRVVFEPVTLEVEQADGTWQTFGDAFQEVIGSTDTQVLAVEWKQPEELVRMVRTLFTVGISPTAIPRSCTFASGESRYHGNARDVLGLLIDTPEGTRAVLRSDHVIPKWSPDGTTGIRTAGGERNRTTERGWLS